MVEFIRRIFKGMFVGVTRSFPLDWDKLWAIEGVYVNLIKTIPICKHISMTRLTM